MAVVADDYEQPSGEHKLTDASNLVAAPDGTLKVAGVEVSEFMRRAGMLDARLKLSDEPGDEIVMTLKYGYTKALDELDWSQVMLLAKLEDESKNREAAAIVLECLLDEWNLTHDGEPLELSIDTMRGFRLSTLKGLLCAIEQVDGDYRVGILRDALIAKCKALASRQKQRADAASE